jgi:hypothetical protein
MEGRLEGLARSLIVKRQRRLLDEIGDRVGTRVVYLKAAWADPVLYGGRGERAGSDVDVLISPEVYDAFGDELLRAGFHKQQTLPLHARRAVCFRGHAGYLDVDLHRGLAQPPWFKLDDAAMFERAETYESADGPLLGLSPSDQLLHVIAHYANSRFLLDDRHLNDAVRVLERFPVDWELILQMCRRGFLEVSLQLVCARLRMRGFAVPLLPETLNCRSRRFALGPFFADDGNRRPVSMDPTRAAWTELLVFLPLLSTRPLALPRLALAVAKWRLARRG